MTCLVLFYILNGLASSYLSDLITPYVPSCAPYSQNTDSAEAFNSKLKTHLFALIDNENNFVAD